MTDAPPTISDLGMLPERVRSALYEGLAEGRGGEVIVRRGDFVGRIYSVCGDVAWVTCDAIKSRLRDLLKEAADIEHDALNAVVEECRQSGANFGETLLQWGLLDRETLRHCLLLHNATHLAAIVKLGSDASAIFVPRSRPYRGTLLFSWRELLEECESLIEAAKSAPPPASITDAVLRETFERVPDCKAIVVFDQATSEVRAMWPPLALNAGNCVMLVEAASHLFGDTRLIALEPEPHKPAGLREIIALGAGKATLMRRGHGSLVVAMLCEDMRNLGMTLGMARNAFPVLINAGWPVVPTG